MDRLSSMDASFLDIEQSGPSVAVGNVMRMSGRAPSLAALRTFIASRLEEMPRFRQKVASSRSKLRQAKWVDVTPDLTYHVKQRRLKAGQSVDPLVSSLMEVPLDRDRPLWDATLVTGYSTEEWTLIVRLHHSIADGQGAVILIGQLIDLDPDGRVRLADGIAAMAAPREPKADIEPASKVEEVTNKTLKIVEQAFRGLGQFIATYPDTVRSAVMLMPQAPSDLTGEVSARRLWVSRQYSLDDVKAARRAFKGMTINDMVLASVAVGFTELLESRGDDPNGRTLRAVMPKSLRRNLETNNQVSILPAPLPLGEMDPLTRMREIRKATKHAKNSTLPIISDTLIRATERVTPAPLQEYVLAKSGTQLGYFSETLITNVPGPMIPLYFMGRSIIGAAPIIPIEGSMRVIVGITSFEHDLNIGITGDGENALDIDVLADGILHGFDQICQMAAERAALAPKKQAAAAAAMAKKREAKSRERARKSSAPRKPGKREQVAKKAVKGTKSVKAAAKSSSAKSGGKSGNRAKSKVKKTTSAKKSK